MSTPPPSSSLDSGNRASTPTNPGDTSPGGDSGVSPAPAIPVVQFHDADNFPPPSLRVLDPDWSPSRLFEWTLANDSVSLTHIRWLARGANATVFSDASPPIDEVDLGSSVLSNSAIDKINNTGAQLLLNNNKVAPFHWDAMTIRLDWATGYATGHSQSAIFTVAQTLGQTALRNTFNAMANSTTADRLGSESVFFRSNATGGDGIGGGGGGGSGATPAPHSSSSGGGLSVGAKAGIGVAAGVVGLLVVGGLVFLLLGRRSRGGTDAEYRHRTMDAAAADKSEMRARATQSSITSPYSDQRESREPISPQQGPRGHSEELLVAASRADGTETIPGGNGGGVSRHLVEEGMTREEILRLEEEERHLDAEIQRARGVDP